MKKTILFLGLIFAAQNALSAMKISEIVDSENDSLLSPDNIKDCLRNCKKRGRYEHIVTLSDSDSSDNEYPRVKTKRRMILRRQDLTTNAQDQAPEDTLMEQNAPETQEQNQQQATDNQNQADGRQITPEAQQQASCCSQVKDYGQKLVYSTYNIIKDETQKVTTEKIKDGVKTGIGYLLTAVVTAAISYISK